MDYYTRLVIILSGFTQGRGFVQQLGRKGPRLVPYSFSCTSEAMNRITEPAVVIPCFNTSS